MPTWRGIVGNSFTPDEFEKYVSSLKFGLWRPRFVVVHNTSAPDLKTWRGWEACGPAITDEKWAQNLVGYYRDEKHWAAGPHLFVTPGGILVFSPLTGPGTHSPAWNSITWGVETVGEFEHEPFAGPVRDNLIAALAILHASAGLQPRPYELGVRGLHFHKEDPITTHKSCPGKNMVKSDLVKAVEVEILRRHGGGGHQHFAEPVGPLDAEGGNDDEQMPETDDNPVPKSMATSKIGVTQIAAGSTAGVVGAAEITSSVVGTVSDVADQVRTVTDKAGAVIEQTKTVVAIPKPGFWFGLLHVVTSPIFIACVCVMIVGACGLTWYWRRQHAQRGV